MRKLILVMVMMMSLPAYAAQELDVSALGSVSAGNKQTTDLGGNFRLELGNLETIIQANYQNNESKVYEQYFGDVHYAYPLGMKWAGFIQLRAERDSKQLIDLKLLEIVGAMYTIIPDLKYSLGVGHRLENTVNSLIASHRFKFEKVMGNIEPVAVVWITHGFDDYEIDSEVGIRFRPYKTFRFGILGTHSFDSAPVEGVEKVDYSARAEITLNLYSAG